MREDEIPAEVRSAIEAIDIEAILDAHARSPEWQEYCERNERRRTEIAMRTGVTGRIG